MIKNIQARGNDDLKVASCSLEINPMVKNKEETPTFAKWPAPLERSPPISTGVGLLIIIKNCIIE